MPRGPNTDRTPRVNIPPVPGSQVPSGGANVPTGTGTSTGSRPPQPAGSRWSRNQNTWVVQGQDGRWRPPGQTGGRGGRGGRNQPTSPTTPAPTAPGGPDKPLPTTPSPFVGADGQGPLGGQPPPLYLGPPAGGGGQWSGASGGFNYGDFNDPYNAFLSAVPLMVDQGNKQISDAMATAGFTGNRYSTGAMDTAGRIGNETAMQINQLMNKTMYDQAQSDLNRALQASSYAGALGSQQDQMQQNRLNALFGFGGWEQGRQDQFANAAYQDWWNRTTWPLQMLIQAGSSQGAGNPGTPYQTIQPGQQPTIPPELIQLIGGLL